MESNCGRTFRAIPRQRGTLVSIEHARTSLSPSRARRPKKPRNAVVRNGRSVATNRLVSVAVCSSPVRIPPRGPSPGTRSGSVVPPTTSTESATADSCRTMCSSKAPLAIRAGTCRAPFDGSGLQLKRNRSRVSSCQRVSQKRKREGVPASRSAPAFIDMAFRLHLL